MIDIIKLIASARRAAEVDTLLQAMGAKPAPVLEKTEAKPRTAYQQAQAEYFAKDLLDLEDVEEARALLNSMGQTGRYSQKGAR